MTNEARQLTPVETLIVFLRGVYGAKFQSGGETGPSWEAVLSHWPESLLQAAAAEWLEANPEWPPNAAEVADLIDGRARRLLERCRELGWTITLAEDGQRLECTPREGGADILSDALAKRVRPHRALLIAHLTRHAARSVLPEAAPIGLIER